MARKPDEAEIIFRFFNEIGIIQQLSSTLFNRRLPDGLHVSHFSVLNHLSKRDFGETPLQLADAFQVSKGTMTHTLGVLTNRGFIQLEPHETDGRSKIVSLTDKGRTFRQQAIARLGPGMAKLGALMDVEMLWDMLPELETIRVILDENRDI
ncbi:MAG: MarR family winged helix-turn-helix transcriptional regulator [Rhizobiaceae bacterium]